MTHLKNLPEKLVQLIQEKEKSIGFVTLEVTQDQDKNAYVLAKRHFDGTYIVWSAFNTGDERTTYDGLYGGSYDLSLEEGIAVMKRRANPSN